MSFKQSIIDLIETHIENYTSAVAEKYGLSKEELLSLWGTKSAGTKKAPPSSLTEEDFSPEKLYKCNKNELSALCKAKGVKCTGTKAELLARLMDGQGAGKVETKTEVKKKTSVGKASRASESLDGPR